MMLKSLLYLFVKPNCVLCQRSADECICAYCQQQLKSGQNKNPCQFWQGELPLFFWGEYGGKIKQAIAALKYEKNPELGEFLGYWLGETWLKCSPISSAKKIIVIPIPLHRKKLKERGFNQSEIIGQGFCHITGYPLKANGLERAKETEAMFGLTPQQRQKNISNAFTIGKDLQKHSTSSPILLLDDIYTTGSTVREAAQVLKSHGFPVVGVVAFAKPNSANNLT